jgi:hypothetical protein
MFMSRHQNVGQSNNIKTAIASFENVAKFRHLGTTARNQNYSHRNIKSRSNSGNACYHLIPYILSSRPILENVRVKMCTLYTVH